MIPLIDCHAHFLPFEDTPVEFWLDRVEIPRSLIYALKKEIKLPYVKALERVVNLWGRKYRLEAAYKLLTANLEYQVEALQSSMEAAGVEGAIVHIIDLNPLDNPDIYETGAPAYDELLERYSDVVKRADPNKPKIKLSMGVDPRRKGVLDLMERFLTDADTPFIAAKFYPKLGFRMNDHKDHFWYSRTLYGIYDFLSKLGIPYLTHGSKGGLSGPYGYQTNLVELFDVHNDFPSLRGCIGHSGGCFAFVKQKGLWLDVERLLMEFPNLYGGLAFHEAIVLKTTKYREAFLKVMGSAVAGQIMWGSDWPLTEVYYSHLKGVSVFRGLAGEENLKTLRGNTNNYLGFTF